MQAALEWLPLDELRVVPVGLPVHRELSGRVSAEQRLAWLATLFAGMPGVVVWDWEVKRSEPTATIDTLRHLAATEPEARPLLLLGGDAFAGMQSWRGYPQHQQLCDVAVFARQGVAKPRLAGWREATVGEWQQVAGSGRVIYLDVSLPDISATELRARLESDSPDIRELPEAIAAEIVVMYGKGRTANG